MGKVKVIKDNDGVAVVEGTPAASLIKDSEKLFNAPMRRRKAGEKLVQRNLADAQREADLQKAMDDAEVMKARLQDQVSPKLVSRDLSAGRGSDQQERMSTQRQGMDPEPVMEADVKEKTPQETEPKRQEAINRTREYKRQRFIERSAGEQAATQGSFITTLQT
jgi:hypothetical protein|tara:strand:- start:90 stop:581 length:492 start_codon:yes stop_codon:yes gene_type:complete